MRQFKMEVGGNYFDGEGLLFTGFFCNGLFYWDIERDKTFVLGIFSEDSLWRDWTFYTMAKWKENFFFLPLLAHGVPYFEADTKEIRYCSLPSCLKDKVLNYYDYAIKNSLVYLFPPKLCGSVAVLDMEQKSVTELISEWSKNIIDRFPDSGEWFMDGFSYQNDKIWISYSQANGVFEMMPDSWKVQFLTWDEIEHPIVLRTNMDAYWIEDQGKATIYRIDKYGDITEKFRLGEESAGGEPQLFSKVIELHNNTKIVLPNFTDKIFLIDTNQRIHCRKLEETSDGISGKYLCFYYIEFQNEVWLLPHSQNDIVIVDLQDYSIRYKKLPIPDEWDEIEKFVLKMHQCEEHPSVEENENEVILHDFCDYIVNRKTYVTEENTYQKQGKKVWRNIR